MKIGSCDLSFKTYVLLKHSWRRSWLPISLYITTPWLEHSRNHGIHLSCPERPQFRTPLTPGRTLTIRLMVILEKAVFCWNSALEHKQIQDSLDHNLMFRLFPGLGHTQSFLGIISVFTMLNCCGIHTTPPSKKKKSPGSKYHHYHCDPAAFCQEASHVRESGACSRSGREVKPTRTLGWRNVVVLGCRGLGHEHSWKATRESQVEKELQGMNHER